MKKHYGFQPVPREIRERVAALVKEGMPLKEALEKAEFDRETELAKVEAELTKRPQYRRLSNGAILDRFGRDVS